jgi:hypothetical protein
VSGGMPATTTEQWRGSAAAASQPACISAIVSAVPPLTWGAGRGECKGLRIPACPFYGSSMIARRAPRGVLLSAVSATGKAHTEQPPPLPL